MSAQTLEKSARFQQAMIDVRDRCMSVREPAAKWEVTKTSLHDRVSGKVEFDRRSGPSSVLTKAEKKPRNHVWQTG